MNWSEPRDLREWALRAFSFRSVIIVLFVLGVSISELRFDWMETTIGAYLTKTNTYRPESGAIWERGHETDAARDTLDQIVKDRQLSQNEVRSADTFAQLIERIPDDHGVMISAQQFNRLYFDLPEMVANEILSSYALLSLTSRGEWERAYFEKTGDTLNIHMLNRENQVLRQVAVIPDLLYHIQRGEVAIPGRLENLSDFNGKIYPAEQFFEVLEKLEPDIRMGILARPEGLLKLGGRVVRVGISDEVRTGSVEMGFEIQTPEGFKVSLAQGREWDVWQLRRRLRSLERRGLDLFGDNGEDRP